MFGRSGNFRLSGGIPVHAAPVEVSGIHRLVGIGMVALIVQLADLIAGVQHRDAGLHKHIAVEHDHRTDGQIDCLGISGHQGCLQTAQGGSGSAKTGIAGDGVLVIQLTQADGYPLVAPEEIVQVCLV